MSVGASNILRYRPTWHICCESYQKISGIKVVLVLTPLAPPHAPASCEAQLPLASASDAFASPSGPAARGMRLAGAAASTANSVLGAVASGVAKRSVRIIDVAGGRSSSSDGRSTSNGTSSTSPPGPIRKSRSSSRSPTFASPGSPEREKGPHGEHEGDESGQSAAPPRRVRIAPE